MATDAINNTKANSTHALFNLSGSNSERVARSLSDWKRHFAEFDNWTRLNALLSLMSYFEVYLNSVVSLAIESDPGILKSASRIVDGIKIAKHSTSDNTYSFGSYSEGITRGEWQKRRKCFHEIFGYTPTTLNTYESELEIMRALRNNTAHAFGRDINSASSREQVDALEINRIQIDRLQRYMAIIREVAREIDGFLLNEHIGDYEAIYQYHRWRSKFRPESRVMEFKRHINSLRFRNKSIAYCSSLIEYYESL